MYTIKKKAHLAAAAAAAPVHRTSRLTIIISHYRCYAITINIIRKTIRYYFFDKLIQYYNFITVNAAERQPPLVLYNISQIGSLKLNLISYHVFAENPEPKFLAMLFRAIYLEKTE